MIGVGIVTYNRPDYFKQCITHILENTSCIDQIIVYNDGSKREDYYPIYLSISQIRPVSIIHKSKNRGVAYAKNALLRALLQQQCDHLFLCEDDILVKNDKAVTEYIKAAEKTGYEHFNFAHHGPANKDGALFCDDTVCYYPHCVGAWSYYSRKAIEQVGYMDENFHNSWEHVAHTKDLGDKGFTSPFGMFIDVKDSQNYLSEIPGSIEGSSIRQNDAWKKKMKEGLAYWKKKDPTVPIEML